MSRKVRETLGKALKEMRVNAGKTQKDVAEIIEKSQAHVYQMEQGITGDIDLYNRAFGIFGKQVIFRIEDK